MDGDGCKDIISGSWPGEIYLFRGTPSGEFLPPLSSKGESRFPANRRGRGRETARENPNTSDGKWNKGREDHLVEFRGKKYKRSPEKMVCPPGLAPGVYGVHLNRRGLPDLK